ncbi:MAG: Prophage Clp protease-like protein [Akkermansiaceae bacterium]|nr:Prophage Clp protease-like protein [Akkermansiaceae bacterium]
MKGNCTRLSRWNGTTFDLIAKRVSISGPALTRETVEEDLTLDCSGSGSAAKKKSPGTKEYGDITCQITWNPAAVTGINQVTTATAAGTVTGAGNALVTLTSAGMTGSPLAINVPVVTGSGGSPQGWADLVRIALAANATVNGRFIVSGTGTAITLTRRSVSGQSVANDGTLNLALATGSATGITAAPTSAATAAGVVGFVNEENHHLFAADFKNETATFWLIEHSNTAASGILVHATVKELGEPSYEPNKTVNRTMTLEPTGEYIHEGNSIATTVLPSNLTAPSDFWGKD